MKAFYEDHQTDIDVVSRRIAQICRIAADRSPQRILDIACGRGTLLRRLKDALPASELRGVDIAERSVDAARALGIDAQVADVTNTLPFADGSQDCVIFGEVIEHIVDPDAALIEIARVLAIDGMLIVSTPNIASWINRVLLLFGIQPVGTETSLHVNLGRRYRAFGQWNTTQGHLKLFTIDALREMLGANGYIVEHVEGTTFYPPNRFEALDVAFSAMPALASNFIVAARNTGSRRTVYPGQA